MSSSCRSQEKEQMFAETVQRYDPLRRPMKNYMITQEDSWCAQYIATYLLHK